MKTNSIKRALRSGYTLVEVVVASSVLMIGVGAACVLSLTMIGQEEMHVRVARGVNVMENATRLYQLGIPISVPVGSTDPTVFSLLPPDPMVSSFTASAETSTAMTGIGAPQEVSLTLDIHPTSDSTVWTPGTWGGRPDTSISGNSDVRTIGPVKVLRHSFRQ